MTASAGIATAPYEELAAAVRGEPAGAYRPPLPLETSLPGVFAAGDVRRGSVKRVASAVGEGAGTIPLVHRHLEAMAIAPAAAGPAMPSLASTPATGTFRHGLVADLPGSGPGRRPGQDHGRRRDNPLHV